MPQGIFPNGNRGQFIKGHKGYKPWLGKTHTEETKRKIAETQKGTKRPPFTEEHRRHLSEALKGNKILSERMKGNKINLGRKPTKESRKKMSEAQRGEKSYRWKGGTKKRYKHSTSTMKYREWRLAVFTRDNYICQSCGKRSKAGEPIYLEAHHIKGWAKYLRLRYKVENGISLCKECHKIANRIL